MRWIDLATPFAYHTAAMLRIVCGVTLVTVVLIGCGEETRPLFNPDPAPVFKDDDRKAVLAEIALLSKGKDTSDIEASAIYSETVQKLTGRGSKIEPLLIEALAGDQDWAVRMGAVEVLQSVGTKSCIDALIVATKDPAPLVALNADKLLSGMTDHRVIPKAGAAPSPEGLPPVPQREADNLALDAEEKLWAVWHQENSKLLYSTWLAWWKANRGTAKLQ